jgi:hypothetical protein
LCTGRKLSPFKLSPFCKEKEIYVASLNNARDGLRRSIEACGEQKFWNQLRPQKDSPPAS